VKVAAVYGAVFLVIVALLFAPFWKGMETLDSTRQNLQLTNSFSISWHANHELQGAMVAAGVAEKSAESFSSNIVKLLGWLVLLGMLAYSALRVREPEHMPESWMLVTLGFLLTTGYVLSWYFIWLIPLLALRPWKRSTKVLLALSTGFIFLGCDLVHP